MIKVAVCGALGKMGTEVCKAVEACPDTKLVAKIDIITSGTYSSIEEAHRVEDIDVLVDFTQPASIYENAKYCLNNGIKIVIGTTGLSDKEIETLRNLSKIKHTGCLIAPNFSTGAVLMMMFAKLAGKYFDNAEIIELHHNQKKDDPHASDPAFAVRDHIPVFFSFLPFTRRSRHDRAETIRYDGIRRNIKPDP